MGNATWVARGSACCPEVELLKFGRRSGAVFGAVPMPSEAPGCRRTCRDSNGEGRKARQSPDHEPETGGESRSGTHNPLVVGSSPTRPTTLYCRAAPSSGTHASVALARHGVPAHRRLSFCCPRRCRIFVHLPVLSRLLSSHLHGSTSPCVVRLRLGRFPWNLKCFRGPFGRSMAWSGSLSGNHGSSPCVSGILRFDILSTHCRMLR